MKRLSIAALLVVWVGSPAWGRSFETGNSQLTKCQAPKDSATYYQRIAICQGYIAGVADTARGAGRGSGGFTFCMPSSATLGQTIDIVTNWLTHNPQHRHRAATVLVSVALSEAWSCK